VEGTVHVRSSLLDNAFSMLAFLIVNKQIYWIQNTFKASSWLQMFCLTSEMYIHVVYVVMHRYDILPFMKTMSSGSEKNNFPINRPTITDIDTTKMSPIKPISDY